MSEWKLTETIGFVDETSILAKKQKANQSVFTEQNANVFRCVRLERISIRKSVRQSVRVSVNLLRLCKNRVSRLF